MLIHLIIRGSCLIIAFAILASLNFKSKFGWMLFLWALIVTLLAAFNIV